MVGGRAEAVARQGAVELEGLAHRDPADRIIVAAAIAAGATLVTSDARIRGYSGVKTIWD